MGRTSLLSPWALTAVWLPLPGSRMSTLAGKTPMNIKDIRVYFRQREAKMFALDTEFKRSGTTAKLPCHLQDDRLRSGSQTEGSDCLRQARLPLRDDLSYQGSHKKLAFPCDGATCSPVLT